MLKHIITICFCFVFITANSQGLRKHINRDSLFQVIINKMPEEIRANVVSMYKDASEREKEFVILLFADGTSSKEELISNIDSNFADINKLKAGYESLVPKDLEVYIEISPRSDIFEKEEDFDISITRKNEIVPIFQEWSMGHGSKELVQAMNILGWTNTTIDSIRVLLRNANTISIENGAITTIGFARSGLGKYSFKLFEKDLTPAEMKTYNNGCQYIFYKNNIVLEYGGGAAGPQCFGKKSY